MDPSLQSFMDLLDLGVVIEPYIVSRTLINQTKIFVHSEIDAVFDSLVA